MSDVLLFAWEEGAATHHLVNANRVSHSEQGGNDANACKCGPLLVHARALRSAAKEEGREEREK